MSKRDFADLLNGADGPASPSSDSDTRPTTKPRLRSPTPPTAPKLTYASAPTGSSPPFQQPTSLISFSYTPERELEFTNSALRYFVQPPRDAQLAHAYDRWNRRPETRGRLDGLLRALSKARSKKHPALASGVGVVAWRGVITRCATGRDWTMYMLTLLEGGY
jgi:RAT1-interacting protein